MAVTLVFASTSAFCFRPRWHRAARPPVWCSRSQALSIFDCGCMSSSTAVPRGVCADERISIFRLRLWGVRTRCTGVRTQRTYTVLQASTSQLIKGSVVLQANGNDTSGIVRLSASHGIEFEYVSNLVAVSAANNAMLLCEYHRRFGAGASGSSICQICRSDLTHMMRGKMWISCSAAF